MIRIIDTRLIIEKYDTHEKHYPKVVSFDCVDSYPLTNAPSATITIISNNNTNNAASVSQVEFDDIVRLQISIRSSSLEQHVWQDVFEGRIQNQSKEFDRNNNIELTCFGHIYEAFYALIENNQSYTNTDARDILSALTAEKLGRIEYSANYAESGLIIPQFNAEAGQVYMSDVLKGIETVSGYHWVTDVLPVYTTSGNLDTCYLKWFQFPTTPTKQYKIIEGTPRLLSATFDVVGEDVRTFRYVKGGIDSSGNQYSGSSNDSAAVAKYGNRYAVDTFTWVMSDSLCISMATGLLSDSKLPYIVGRVELEGIPAAKKGDLVTVKIPSLEANGAEINGNYIVYKVNQSFSHEGFRTTLDLGRIKK